MVASAPELLHTKLAIPSARAELVSRPRLIEQFSQGLNRPLTLICAPAGFGKTTLLNEWLDSEAGSGVPLAWVSLDEDDNDPGRFLTYLVYALVTIGSTEGNEALALLQSPQPPPPKVILTSLISRLETSPHHFALALYDYHLITSQTVHEAVAFLLDHLPAQMRLILISREDPPLPLSRLRGRGQLSEIRADDLRFTREEAATFLQQTLGISLTAQQVMDLDARTEGWIAGLQLAALAMKGREDVADFISAFTGSHRFILDYLTEEVLNRQPESIQSFLLQTSILSRMCSPLCNAITGRTDGQANLEQIERGNLFLISLDDERYWYRYHHLFGDMLHRHLQRTTPDLVSELHRRASVWFEQNGWVAEAVEEAFWGEDTERAASLVEQYGERMWMRGELTTVLRWMQALPDDAICARPQLGLNYAFILTLMDEFIEAERRIVIVEQVLLQEGRVAGDAKSNALMGKAAAVRATVSLLHGHAGDLTIAAGAKALDHLPESDLRWRAWTNATVGVAHFTSNGEMNEAERHLKEVIRLSEKSNDAFTLMIGLSQLSRMYMIKGRLQQAEVSAERLLRDGMASSSRAQAQLDRSLVRYERNDLQGAIKDVTEARRIFDGYLLKRFSIDGCVIMARLKWLQGEETEAHNLMKQAMEIAQTDDMRQTFVSEAAWQTWLWLKQGDVQSAAVWAQDIEPTIHDHLNPALEFEHMTLARVLIAQGRLDAAQELLTRLFSAANSAGRMGRVITICVLQALASSLQGNTDQALESLTYALSLGEPEDYVRTFVDEGPPMEELLGEAKARGISVPYVTRLLAAFDHIASAETNAPSPQRNGGDFESLSARELDVLRLIADGASNREIADSLVVSLGTVKKHLNNIFLKLDAHSRTQVIATARKQNLF